MVSLAGGRHEAGVSVIQDRHRPAPGESSERLEELQERAIPADGKPVQSRFMRCKDARVMLDGRSTLERCEHAGWFTPLRPGTIDDLQARRRRSHATACLVGRVALNWRVFFLQDSSFVASIGLPSRTCST